LNSTISSITDLAEAWRQLWNGATSLTEQIIHPEWVAHAAPITGGPAEEKHGRASLAQWVQGINALIPDLEFTFDVGPIAAGDFLVVRWKAFGTYGGGFATASPDAVGRSVTFYGTDTLRLRDGLLAEYWANADSLWLVQQLGVEQVPALTAEQS
jgi:predicted ester cyclase